MPMCNVQASSSWVRCLGTDKCSWGHLWLILVPSFSHSALLTLLSKKKHGTQREPHEETKEHINLSQAIQVWAWKMFVNASWGSLGIPHAHPHDLGKQLGQWREGPEQDACHQRTKGISRIYGSVLPPTEVAACCLSWLLWEEAALTWGRPLVALPMTGQVSIPLWRNLAPGLKTRAAG